MSWAQIINDFAAAPKLTSEDKPKPTHKVCIGCKQELPLNNFYVRKGHGHTSRCKPCYYHHLNRKDK